MAPEAGTGSDTVRLALACAAGALSGGLFGIDLAIVGALPLAAGGLVGATVGLGLGALLMALARRASERPGGGAFGWTVVIMLAIVITPLGLYRVGAVRAERAAQRPFEGAAWRIPADRQAYIERLASGPQRRDMLADLLASGRLAGLTRDQLLELLGPSEAPAGDDDTTLAWELGGKPTSFTFEREWLVVLLDHTGRVQDVRVEAR